MNDSAVVSAEQTTSNEVLNLVPGIIIESALFGKSGLGSHLILTDQLPHFSDVTGILTLLVLASAVILWSSFAPLHNR